MGKYNGISNQMRKDAVIKIYEKYQWSGLSTRYIWKNFIYPEFGISERTLYNYLKQSL